MSGLRYEAPGSGLSGGGSAAGVGDRLSLSVLMSGVTADDGIELVSLDPTTEAQIVGDSISIDAGGHVALAEGVYTITLQVRYANGRDDATYVFVEMYTDTEPWDVRESNSGPGNNAWTLISTSWAFPDDVLHIFAFHDATTTRDINFNLYVVKIA